MGPVRADRCEHSRRSVRSMRTGSPGKSSGNPESRGDECKWGARLGVLAARP
jgi:hypothetical protein